MNPIPHEWLGIPEEVLRLHPPMTPACGAARQKADLALQDTHPGQYVAYVDNWTGDELKRVVVASALDVAAFQTALKGLPADVRDRAQTTRVPDPEEGIFAGGSGLV